MTMTLDTARFTEAGLDAEQLLEEFQAELKQFEKPTCGPDQLEAHSIKELLEDLHRAIYGNGKTCGLIWKTTELSMILKLTSQKHNNCRGDVLAHFTKHAQEERVREQNPLRFFARHKVISSLLGIILFFGISSLWSILLQEREASKVEKLVLAVVSKYVPAAPTVLAVPVPGTK